MQKKYIYLILIIIFNIIIVVLGLYATSKDMYSDEFVNTKTQRIKTDINNLLINTQQDISTIKNTLNITKNIDSLNNYFINFLEQKQNIDDILLIENNFYYKIGRENDSYVSAVDSTKNIDIIKWKRIKNKQIVSEWNEIFSIDKNMLYLIKKIDKSDILWNIGTRTKNNLTNEFITIATTWQIDTTKIHLIISFKEEKIINAITEIKKIDDVDLLIETNDSDIFYIPSSKLKQAELLTKSFLKQNDSLENVIYNNYKKVSVEKDSISIFSFEYKDLMYWTTVFKPINDFGVSKFIVTFSTSSITKYQTKKNNAIYLIITLSILISLTVFYLIFFKKKQSTKILSNNNRDINLLLEKDENRFLEFKSSLRWDYRQEKPNPDLEMVIVKTIAAFGNSDGGNLLIGVDDNKKILGLKNDYTTLKKQDSDYFEIYLRNILHKFFGVKYTTENIRINFPIIEKKEICLIEVFKANTPAYIKTKDKQGNPIEKFYVRSGNSSQELKSLQDINDYIFERFRKE